jgi:hypothetical protein
MNIISGLTERLQSTIPKNKTQSKRNKSKQKSTVKHTEKIKIKTNELSWFENGFKNMK